MVATQRVQAGAWEISYTCRGEGPALVLLHGGAPGASGESNFQRNAEVLARHFRTYVIDFPGWGASSKNLVPAGQWGNPLEAAGQAVLAFMDAVGIGQAHLMGGSFGAAAALHAAMAAPQRIGRLVLMAPGGGLPSPGTPMPLLGQLFGYYAGEGPTREKFEQLTLALVHDRALMPPPWLDQRYAASLDAGIQANPPLRLPPGYVPEPAHALCRDPRLATLSAPVLFLWGREDRMQPLSCLDSFAALPQQDAVILGRCGHLPYLEQPEAVNALALWHLGRG